MVIEFLWLYASQETSLHKTSSSRSGIICTEAWQWLPRYHEWWPSTFQLYLSKQTRDLHSIYRWAFGTRLNHKLQVVVRKTFQQTTRNASPVVKNISTLHLQIVILHNILTWSSFSLCHTQKLYSLGKYHPLTMFSLNNIFSPSSIINPLFYCKGAACFGPP
jgi:hypothetical protein